MNFTRVNRAQPVAAQRHLEQCAEALDCVSAGRCFEDQRKALTAGFSGSLANRIRARVMLKRETTDGPVFAMRAGPFPFSLLICRLVDGCDLEAETPRHGAQIDVHCVHGVGRGRDADAHGEFAPAGWLTASNLAMF